MQIIFLPFILVVGVVQMWLGFVGIEYLLGFWWAIGAVAVVFVLRIFLPLSVGSYFAMVSVFGYPWWAGVLVAAPGLIFILPGLIKVAFESFAKRP